MKDRSVDESSKQQNQNNSPKHGDISGLKILTICWTRIFVLSACRKSLLAYQDPGVYDLGIGVFNSCPGHFNAHGG